MKILGVDNVFFYVSNLDEGIAHYSRLGFHLKFQVPALALFGIGSERPGLILKQKAATSRSQGACFWVEVVDAALLSQELTAEGIKELRSLIETATGFTLEVADPWGNVVGFADYKKRPALARPQ